HRYWQMPIAGPVYYKNPREYVDRFSELFEAAVADRLRTSRAAVMMSGGLDSTSIAATAHGLLSQSGRPFELRASPIVYARIIRHHERHYASLVGNALRIPIDFEVADSYKLLDRREHEAIRCPAEPRSLASAARQTDRTANAAASSRVVLHGVG